MPRSVGLDWGSDKETSDFEVSDDEPAYEVERIIAQRMVDDTDQYLVKWNNFGDEDCTWEPAESFDQSLSISIWEAARARGDVLDTVELQDVERKMARRRAEHENEEASHQESKREELVRTLSSDVSRAAERPPLTKNDASIEIPVPKNLSSISVKRKAKSPIQSTSKARAEPLGLKQGFYGLSDKLQTARRTTATYMSTAHSSLAGKPFRNLSHQNNAQKRRRQEPAPNINQLSTLRPVTELVPTHDVALNLPSGPRPLPIARNVTQAVFVEAENGRFEQLVEPKLPVVSTEGPAVDVNEQHTAISELPRYKQTSHPVFRSAPQQHQDMLVIRYENQVFPYKWGEVVVQMYMGARLIGHVKIVGLLRPGEYSTPLIAGLLRTRQGFVLEMRFEQEDAYNLQDYTLFEREVSAVGSLEPFDNAKDNFYELLSFLASNSRATGVWRHHSVPWIMVAYASRASVFADKGFPSALSGLAFIVCRRIPWREAPLIIAQPQPSLRNDETHMANSEETETLHTSTAMDIILSPVAPIPGEASHDSLLMIGLESTDAMAQVENGISTLDQPGATAVKDVPADNKQQGPGHMRIEVSTFEERYGLSYEKLTRIPVTVKPLTSKEKFDRGQVRFFLAFDEDKKDEEAELTRWLSTRTPAYMIYSSSQDFAWVRYKEAMRAGEYIGIILIHEDFLHSAFTFMVGLARRIRREDLQVFRVSLGRPLYDLSLRHYGRIFPSGLVLLITESTLFTDPKGTAAVFDWFAKSGKAKRNWRLFLRPCPEQYLLDACKTTLSEEDRSAYLRSLVHLRALQQPLQNVSSPIASPIDDDELPSYILAPLSLPIYSKGEEATTLFTSDVKKMIERDEKLVDFFCGWAYSQVSSFRRFVAVTRRVPEDTRIRNSHVEFLQLAEFEREHMGKQGDFKVTEKEGSDIVS